MDVADANKVAASVKVIKDDCQADLDLAMPAYESAVKALATLDKKSVQEMKVCAIPCSAFNILLPSFLSRYSIHTIAILYSYFYLILIML